MLTRRKRAARLEVRERRGGADGGERAGADGKKRKKAKATPVVGAGEECAGRGGHALGGGAEGGGGQRRVTLIGDAAHPMTPFKVAHCRLKSMCLMWP